MKNFGKNIVKFGIITTVISCLLLLVLYLGMEARIKNQVVQNLPICQAGGGGHFVGINSFSECYDCAQKVVFSEQELSETFPEVFSDEEINQYAKKFFQLDHPYIELEYDAEKRYCFYFVNGQFYQLHNGNIYNTPIYEDKQVESERNSNYNESSNFYNGKKDFVVYYKNGKLKAKRETLNDGKEIYYESYYNNGQIRSKEWRIVVKKPSNECVISKDENGKEIQDCTYSFEGLIGLEEYYKNGQLRIKIEKGSIKKDFTRTRHKNYLNIPYEMYDKNGKLTEKSFGDGTTEKYRDDGSLREKCDPVSGSELAGEQCCIEVNEDGITTGVVSCNRWIS